MRHATFAATALAIALTWAYAAEAEAESRKLHENWRFRQGRSEIWYPATVPGTVHTDLMKNDIIDDPFFRLNERAVQWVDKEDWMYETTFTAAPAETKAGNQQIIFHGLDTYADVYLNHEPLLTADNMHRTWVCDVKGKLRDGANLLEVYFHSPIKTDLPKFDKYDYTFNTGPDQSQNGGIFDKTLSIFARKAGYHYGWDWGPRLVTSGIWRDVELQTWNGLKIDNVQYVQTKVDASKAQLTTIVRVLADADMQAARVEVRANGKTVGSRLTDLKKGENRIAVDYTIRKPRLWWTNGLGEPYRYDFRVTVDCGELTDSQDDKVGIRSLRLITEDDQYGRSLAFELNGKQVFMKGADMIPLDNFLPRVGHDRYEKHVLDAKAVNMNMLRVWGGGVYEDDYFYELCDRHGILVWQDFMFACSTYPADSTFLANIRQEAIDNVERLRNHCCIALWCGNNECQDVYYGWGGRYNYYKEKGVEELTTCQFKDMYFRTLPEVVTQYGGGISYRPSSPYAFEETASDGIHGDAHYWGVWHGRDSIGHYNVEKARFFSEYGFQSFPEFESVKIYAPQERDWNINSEVMMAHQRAGSYANNLIREYMDQEYRTPDDFQSFLYVGSILQGDAIKTAIEAHRRDMPRCMGTLVWQHNDCWPVASWAGRDYYGRWKAQQYYSRVAYDDILVSPVVIGDTLSVTIVSDRRTPATGVLTITAMTLDGQPFFSRTLQQTAAPLTAACIFSDKVANLLAGRNRGDVIFHTTYQTGTRTYENVAYATKQKHMNYTAPDYKTDIARAKGGFDVTIGSDIFARGVFLSLDGIDNFFSDNYFDILPGSERTIHVTTSLSEDAFRKQLKIISMGDIHDRSTIADGHIRPATAPNATQRRLADRGYGMFVHFGLNTFIDREWGEGTEPATTYAPTALDCDQWVRTARDGGFRYVLLVAKHHDGFCLWDSRYTDYDVASSMDTTDVVGAVADACRRYGLQFGIYYSLWDRHEPTYTCGDFTKYVDYMCNQLTELLTGYGDICELWLDGAWDKPGAMWELPRIYELVKKYHPHCAVGVNGTIGTGEEDRGGFVEVLPDRMTQDNIFHMRYFPGDFRLWDPKIASRNDKKQYLHGGESYYLPFEHTICLSKEWNWFQKSEPKPTRDLDELEELFYLTTANGNSLVINVPPDRTGRMCDHEVNAVVNLRRRLGIEQGKALPTGGRYLNLRASSATSTWPSNNDEYKADKMCDGGMQTRWASTELTPTVEFALEPDSEFDRITMFEYCDTESLGDFSNRRTNRIQAYSIDCYNNGEWTTIHVADSPMGDCGVINFAQPVKASRLRLNVHRATAPPSLYEFNAVMRH